MEIDLTKKSLKELGSWLTVPQVCGIVVAFAGLLSAAFTLGTVFERETATTRGISQDVVPCYKAAGYPLGKWNVSASIDSGDPDEVSSAIHMQTPTSGTVQTSEKLGRVLLDRELVPGNKVVETEYEASSEYRSTFNDVVSRDGCYITGQWEDSDKHQGEMELFWRERGEYLVKK